MSQAVPTSYVARRTFADVDDLAVEAQQWNLDFRQLDRGKLRADLLQFGAGNVHISNARFDRLLNQKGAPPAGMRTIAVPAKSQMEFLWRGKRVDGDSLLVFPRGAELSSVSGTDFHVYTCSIPEQLLAHAGEILGATALENLEEKKDAIRCPAPILASLRNCLAGLCRSARRDALALPSPEFANRLSVELPQRLIQAIAESTSDCPPATSRKRLQAWTRAETYIARYASEPISIGDICQAACVSQRTLEYMFAERFGITPQEFVSTFRLTEVRRQLRTARSATDSVADIANRWGFWHMGQFAADYRRRFDELPSETLRDGGTAQPG